MTLINKAGVLGGLSYLSTIYYYKNINQLYFKKHSTYPELALQSLNLEIFNKYLNSGEFKKLEDYMLCGLRKLESAGVSVIVIASNTPHFMYNQLSKKISTPIYSILDALYQDVRKKDLRTLLLLGTKTTMEKGYYTDYFKPQEVEIIIPDRSSREYINKILFSELVKNQYSSETMEHFYGIIHKSLPKGVDGVIMGCTEIPFLLKEKRYKLKYLDTGLIHCRNLVNNYLK